MKKLSTIFTLGPASEKQSIIKKLLQNGDRFRLNSSHLTPKKLDYWLQKLQLIFDQSGKTVPVIIDLQGAKMRIGRYPKTNQLPDVITLFHGTKSHQIDQIPVPHDALFDAIKVGEQLSLNDCKIIIEIISIKRNNVTCKVISNGPLSSHKGINRKEHPLPYNKPLQRDLEMIDVAQKYPFTQFALSFTLTGKERTLFKIDRHFIAKIEHPEALKHLKTIDQNFDELWLCRGDLGAQGGLNNLYQNSTKFENAFPELNTPCVLAGEVLEHLTIATTPTRSEIVYFEIIKERGYDGVVFSNETAVGIDPVNVAQWVKKLNQL